MSADPFDSLVHQSRLADDIENQVKSDHLEEWRPLPYEPVYCDYHPCIHRWFKKHNEPRPPRKVSHKYKELSERTVWLAHPLVRRLLWLWICHANTLSPDRRARLKTILISYGYTDEELERYIVEELKRIERARRKTIIENEGGILEQGQQDDYSEDEVEYDENGEIKKKKHKSKKKKKTKGKEKVISGKCKVGKPGKGWPHAIGMELFDWLWTTLMSRPDEVYLSRAREYFDVQASILLEICHDAMGNSTIHDPSGCLVEQKIAIACLNVVTSIAKNIVAPAQKIADKDIENLLKLGGALPKPKKAGKKKGKAKKKGKKKKAKPKKKESVAKESLPDGNNDIEVWPEISLPLSVSCRSSATEDPIENFKKTLIWYQPREPEFICEGSRVLPPDLLVTAEDDEQMWSLESHTDLGLCPPQRLIPEAIPPYFENIRPMVHSFRNDRDEKPQPWYIMAEPSYYEPGQKIADMAAIVELTEIFFHMLQKLVSIKNISMLALLEMMQMGADAANCAVEDATPEDLILDNKRTIILERIFVNFFGFAFRDYNDRTRDIMHSLCHRGAVMIRHIYRYTAHTLWTLQRRDIFPIQRKLSFEVPPDDEIMLEAWDAWLAWLAKITSLGKEWAAWLEACNDELMTLAAKAKAKPYEKWVKKARVLAEEWYDVHEETIERSFFFARRASSIGQVNSRPVPQGYIYEKRFPDEEWISDINQPNIKNRATNSSMRYDQFNMMSHH